MILIHGRGASAADIMTVAAELMHPGFAYLAPQAAGGAWYPNPFTAPLADNEPYLSSALEVVASLLATIERTVLADRIILLGFSQGACLTLEFAARNARHMDRACGRARRRGGCGAGGVCRGGAHGADASPGLQGDAVFPHSLFFFQSAS